MKNSVKKTMFLILAIAVIITACDGVVGLGYRINTDVPVITIPPGDDNVRRPGDFLRGDTNIINLNVEQPFGLHEVYMTIWFYDNDGNPQEVRVPAVQDPGTGLWSVNIDTLDLNMEDGEIRTQVTAIDKSGNITTTTDIIFFVKNLPPQIEMGIPSLFGADFDLDGTPGQHPLFPSGITLTDFLEHDHVMMGLDLMGVASDNAGIRLGYPQIMLWPADHDTSVLTRCAQRPNTCLDANGIPTCDRFGTFRPARTTNQREGQSTVRFSWPMVHLVADAGAPGGFRLPANDAEFRGLSAGTYRFRVRVKDIFDIVNYYPNRTDNRQGVSSSEHPNHFMQIQYTAADLPIITITNLPDNYNGMSNFVVDFRVNHQNPLTTVIGVISQDMEGTALSTVDAVRQPGGTSTVSIYRLTFTSVHAATWPPQPDNDTLFINIIARDENGNESPPVNRSFIFDTEAPRVNFDRPAILTNEHASGNFPGGHWRILYPDRERPRWVTGPITVGGTSMDNFTVSRLYFHKGMMVPDNATVEARLAAYLNPDNWTNTNLHDPREPVPPGWSGSVFAWRYDFDFNFFKTQANSHLWQEASELMNWPTGFMFDTDGDFSQRFYLPFYVKAVDSAGNISIVHYKLCIDPDMDIPMTTIGFPAPGDEVGGTVRLSGVATDNDRVLFVLIRITKDNGTFYIPDTAAPFYAGAFANYPVWQGITRDGWFRANIIGDGPSVSWFYNINADHGLNPPGDTRTPVKIEVKAIDTRDLHGENPPPNLAGPPEVVNVFFSNNVPTVSNPRIIRPDLPATAPDHDRDYFEGIRASRQFEVRMSITAGSDLGVNSLRGSLNNVPFTLIRDGAVQPSLSGWRIENRVPAIGSPVTFDLILDFDSLTQIHSPTGVLRFELDIENARTPPLSTRRTYSIDIDNFFPSSVITTAPNASGTAFMVEGIATDYGPGSGVIQGLERVLVFFEEAQITYPGNVRTITGTGQFRNPRGIQIPRTDLDTPRGDPFYGAAVTGNRFDGTPARAWATAIPPMTTRQHVWNPAITGTPHQANVPVLNNFPVLVPVMPTDRGVGHVWMSPHAMIIDSQEIGADVDIDGDGTYGEVWQGIPDRIWGARLNTTLFPDGPMIVHYVIMDQAGNSTYYRREMFIENNRPVIASIDLGTNLRDTGPENWDYAGPITVLNFMNPNSEVVTTPAFRIRGNGFGINLQINDGNGNLNYRVMHVSPLPAINAANMVRGQVYTIATPGNTEWQRFGAPHNMAGITFVATGPAPGTTGTVTPYNTITEMPFTPTNSPGSRTQTLRITDFTGVEDSPLGAGEIPVPNDRRFIVKVYDSTVGGEARSADQLAHAVMVRLSVDNTDRRDPTIQAAPFGQEFGLRTSMGAGEGSLSMANNLAKVLRPVTDFLGGYNRNIVMQREITMTDNGGVRRGYVQYAANSLAVGLPNRDHLSGKVIFTGRAEDNQRIQRIEARIGNGAWFTIGQWNASLGRIVPATVGGTSMTIDNLRSDTSTATWGFRAIEEHLTLNYGHVLNWEFAWDSSSVPNADNVAISFRATDAAAPANRVSSVSTRDVRVVPYISEVITGLSRAFQANPSAFNRSALGWYPVRENEVIQIRGFNFNGTSTIVRLNNTQLAAPSVVEGNTRTHISVNIGTAATSGALEVEAHGITSINNRTGGTGWTLPAYNTEPNNLNNNTLTNRRQLYVWSVGTLLNEPASTARNPFMRVSDAGRRFISYGHTASTTSSLLRVNRDGVDNINASSLANRWINTSVAFDTDGNSYGIGSNITATAGGNRFSVFAKGNNERQIYQPLGEDINRFEIPRLAVRGTTELYISYFDANNDRVVFRRGTHTGTTTWGGDLATNNNNNRQIVAESNSGFNAGMYTAVGFLSDGRPVIAWHSDSGLIFSFGNVSGTTPTATWQQNARVIDTTNPSAGAHVDMVVDGDGNVHLAYYDIANGGLHYAFIPSAIVTNSTSRAGLRIARVDTFLSAGTKIMLTVRNEGQGRNIPYISYFHGSFTETLNSVRVAWPTVNPATTPQEQLQGTDDDDRFTGVWEVMTVPVASMPLANEFITNGVPTGNSWASAGTSGFGTTTPRNSIVVGYMTRHFYEGAILKGTLFGTGNIFE